MSVWIGFDPPQATAFAICRYTLERRLTFPIPVYGIVLDRMRERTLYQRPTSIREGRLWDDISEAPMSTEFAISRFLTLHLARWERRYTDGNPGWALFMDCDMLIRANVARLFDEADERYAVMCVKHVHEPPEGMKMDGQAQVRYARKNWSSMVLWNLGHPANDALTLHEINRVPGRDLHRFYWLDDDLIGELHPRWNYLVGHTDPSVDPAIVHFTEGTPIMPGYENAPYADEWRRELQNWAQGRFL